MTARAEEANEESSNPTVSLLTPDEIRALRAHEATLSDRDFILRWVRYGESRTDAPREFHEAVAHILVATAIDRARYLDLGHKRVFPSQFRLNLAGSGQRKSTPHSYAEDALSVACPALVLANDYSAEALVKDLAERPHSRGTALIDEAGRLLGTMRKNNYGEGLKDLLSKMWDCPENFERALMKGRYQLQSVYVNLLMATTPSRFYETATPDDIASGFLARFLPVMVTRKIVRKPLTTLASDVAAVGTMLSAALKAMHDRIGKNPKALPITPDGIARLDTAEAALETWAQSEYHADLITPWARRLAEYAARLTIIFTVSEGIDDADLPQVLRALAVVDRAKEDVRVLVQELRKGQGAPKRDQYERYIREHPGVTGRELQRATSDSAKEAWSIVSDLKEQDRIRIEMQGTNRYICWPAVKASYVENVA